jgi:hypothetical protein
MGSASGRLSDSILAKALFATGWYAAHDADEAGEKAAAEWLKYPRSRRVRPPLPFKDWTAFRQEKGEGDLLAFWLDVLDKTAVGSPLESSSFLAGRVETTPRRPAAADPGPDPDAAAAVSALLVPDFLSSWPVGSDHPSPAAAFASGLDSDADDYAASERFAIQRESEPVPADLEPAPWES